MSFDPNATDNLNIVRQMIGDTSATPILTDTTITYYLNQQTTLAPNATIDLLDVSVQCLQLIAAAYSQLADRTVGDLSIRYSQQYAQINQLIDRYKEEMSGRRNRLARLYPGTVYSGTKEIDTLSPPYGRDAANRPSGIMLRNSVPPRETRW